MGNKDFDRTAKLSSEIPWMEVFRSGIEYLRDRAIAPFPPVCFDILSDREKEIYRRLENDIDKNKNGK